MSDKLLQLIKRRHPEYQEKLPHWEFVEDTYEGGRGWFEDNIFRFLKEGDKEYKDRVERAYRFNHTKQVVDLVDKYLFRQVVARKHDDAPDCLKEFWKKATLSGQGIDTFAKHISSATSKFGRVYIVVDTNKTDSGTGKKMSRAEAKKLDIRPYAYIVRPQDMLDMSYDDQGNFRWCLIAEKFRDDVNPMNSTGQFKERFRLWTTTKWTLYELRKTAAGDSVVRIDGGDHDLGMVPVIQADHTYSDEAFEASGLIDDIAYLDRANANYLSNLDAIIQDQTFSQLAMPAQGVLPGEKGYDALLNMGTKRVFLYNGDGTNGPAYLSPDPKQAELVLTAIGKIVGEIYHSVGLVGERNQNDNGGGIDNASGVAKAYDFERVNSLLASKADALQVTERRLAALVAKWCGEDQGLDEELVTYPRDFDTRGLYDEFEIGARLNLLGAPDEIRRDQMAALTRKLFPAASQADVTKYKGALKTWPPEDSLGLGASGASSSGPIKAAGTQKTAKELAA